MDEYFYSIEQLNNYRRRLVPKQYPHVDISHVRVDGNQKGGMTLVRLWLIKGCLITGIAFCCDLDTYDKRKGKSIAVGRLLRALKRGLATRDYLETRKFISERVGYISISVFLKAFDGEHIE